MANIQASSQTIAELREFACFGADEQLFIERSLDVALGRGDAFKDWAANAGSDAIRTQYIAYRGLKALRSRLPSTEGMDGVGDFLGPLVRITAQDLAQERLDSFSAYRFLYERLLGGRVRPFLPAAFCGAAALPQIRPDRRKMLLQSLSEAAATAPAWSTREPAFYPERMVDEAA